MPITRQPDPIIRHLVTEPVGMIRSINDYQGHRLSANPIEDIPCSTSGSLSPAHEPLSHIHQYPLNRAPPPPQMAPTKSQKSRQSSRADAGGSICESCGMSIRNRGRKQHKCKGNGGTSLGDVFKEMAEQEAMERGMFNVSYFVTLNNLSFTARTLSLMASESSKQGQSSRSECY